MEIKVFENINVPENICLDIRSELTRIVAMAENFNWRLCDIAEANPDAYSRRLTAMAYSLATIMNALAEEVVMYRTDFIYDLLHLNDVVNGLEGAFLKEELPIAMIGLREFGTDHIGFLESRLRDQPGTGDYRAIFLVTLQDYEADRQTVMRTYLCKGRR